MKIKFNINTIERWIEVETKDSKFVLTALAYNHRNLIQEGKKIYVNTLCTKEYELFTPYNLIPYELEVELPTLEKAIERFCCQYARELEKNSTAATVKWFKYHKGIYRPLTDAEKQIVLRNYTWAQLQLLNPVEYEVDLSKLQLPPGTKVENVIGLLVKYGKKTYAVRKLVKKDENKGQKEDLYKLVEYVV